MPTATITSVEWHKYPGPRRGKFVPYVEIGCSLTGWHYRFHMVSEITDVVTKWEGQYASKTEAFGAGLTAFGYAVRALDAKPPARVQEMAI